MRKSTACLVAFRVLAVLVAGAGIGLGAWCMYTFTIAPSFEELKLTDVCSALTIVHDVEMRGSIVLNSLILEAEEEARWRRFFDTVINSQTRIWITIAAVSSFGLFLQQSQEYKS
jgi:hypothetical protein